MKRRDFLTGAAALTLSPELAHAAAGALAAADFGIVTGDLDGDIAPRPMRLVQGKPPADLAGTLYRNGPARFRRPGRSVTHWFDGDGLVRKFSVGGGQASLAARFVDTPKRRADIAANAMIGGGFGTESAPGAAMASPDDVNAANTSVIARGNELWALWEAGSPFAIDPDTLETRGPRTLGPDLEHMPFLAHPRFEPDGRLWNLGQLGDRAVVWHLAPSGALLSATPLPLPRASYTHDFTMTAKHLIVVLQPWIYDGVTANPVATLRWRPEMGTRILVIDKDDLTRRRIYELPALFFFHMASAWIELDGAIAFDICLNDSPAFAIQGAADILRGVYRNDGDPTSLALIRLMPDGRATLDRTGIGAEFPRIDQRFTGQPRSMTLHAAAKAPERPMFQGVATYDWRSRTASAYDFGADHVVEEMVFVPRPGASEEMDGWAIGPTLNLRERATELHVFDTRRIAEGPVCTWRTDVSLPMAFHGFFRGA